MYSGFQVSIGANPAPGALPEIDFGAYQALGQEHLKGQAATVQHDLHDFLLEGTTLYDGAAMEESWFPQVKADVFISHSHKDLALAEGLAGWLHTTFGLTCFIDYNVWGYSDDLLWEINSRYSNKRSTGIGGCLYDYESCVAASKHVDTMLTIALHKMIDRCESVFLLNTDNSVRRYGEQPHDTTSSPWIYSEIVCSQIVRPRKLSDFRPTYIEHRADGKTLFAMDESFQPLYSVTLDHLLPLDLQMLERWDAEHLRKGSRYALDDLYPLFPDVQRKLRG